MNAVEFLELFSNGYYTVKQCASRDEWLKARQSTLGASEAAVIYGESPWMNEVQLWKRKTGRDAEGHKGNADTQRGSMSEEHIRALYGIEHDTTIYDGTGIILTSSVHPWMSCTLDGFYIDEEGDPAVLEIKSVHLRTKVWDDSVPKHYYRQVLHQLVVTGWYRAHLLARFCQDLQVNATEEETVFHASDLQEDMYDLIAKERVFWNNYVVGGRKPPVTMPSL